MLVNWYEDEGMYFAKPKGVRRDSSSEWRLEVDKRTKWRKYPWRVLKNGKTVASGRALSAAWGMKRAEQALDAAQG